MPKKSLRKIKIDPSTQSHEHNLMVIHQQSLLNSKGSDRTKENDSKAKSKDVTTVNK